jgi:hypothetical protein
MNERIKELAYQTKLKTGALPGSEEWQTVFTELIVRECIDAGWLSANDTKSKEWQSGYTKGQLDARVLIKAHFGVSE